MARLFDAYIMVDWSAASAPKTGRDSIWIADLRASSNRIRYDNPPTRRAVYDLLKTRLRSAAAHGERVLLGVDFSLGYPSGTAKALGLSGAPWKAMHDWLAAHVEDAVDNTNNRFAIAATLNDKMSGQAFPFWGVTSQRSVGPTLSATKPDFTDSPLAELRLAEHYIREIKLGAPKSGWQLAYIGSVGSQSLTGIPYVHKLRAEFPKARLWPFETGFKMLTPDTLSDTEIIIAEIYPSLLSPRPKSGEPPDKAQVRAIARHYWQLDKTAQLGAAFAPPSSLNTVNLSNIDTEEGWILGISPITIGNLGS